jgi:hypothetical protein
MSKFTDERDAIEQDLAEFKAEHPTAFGRLVLGIVCFLVGFIVGHFAA